MIREWRILKRRQIADYRIFTLHEKQVRSPRTNQTIDVHAIHFPDWVMILALTPENEAVMVRQYRHGTEQICLELPGGLVDPEDASPELSAQRELLEETGYAVSNMQPIGECYPQPAILSNRCFFYLANNAVAMKGQYLDAGEDIDIVTVPLHDIPAMIESREINHGMVLQAFFFYMMGQGRGADSFQV